MVIAWFLSVVIDIINVRRAIIKTENHPPVGPDSYGPKAFPLTFERVQPETRQVHMNNGRGGMQRGENITQFVGMFPVYPARVTVLKKPFQSLVANCPYHRGTVTRHVSDVSNNIYQNLVPRPPISSTQLQNLHP